MVITHFFLILVIVIINRSIKEIFKQTVNIYTILSVIWVVFVSMAILTNRYLGDYPTIGLEAVFMADMFIITVGVIMILISKVETSNKNKKVQPTNILNYKALNTIVHLLFIVFILSNFLYFIRLNELIGLRNIVLNPYLWKSASLSENINENSILYIGRNIPILGSLLLIVFLKKRKFYTFILVMIYYLVSLTNIRRDPVMIQLIYFILPFIINYGNSVTKIVKVLIPTISLFLVIFITTMDFLTFGSDLTAQTIASYTFGSFNSLQYALKNGYQNFSQIPLNYSFYWVYTITKFLFSNISVPNIILQSVPNGGNVYTGLINIVIDSKGNLYTLLIVFVIYTFYVSIILYSSMRFLQNKLNLFSIAYYGAVLSASIRFYMNPTFSGTEIFFSLIIGIILQILYMFLINKKGVI